jgi:hypothetical protein
MWMSNTLTENNVASNTPIPANQRIEMSQDRLLINSSSDNVLRLGGSVVCADKSRPPYSLIKRTPKITDSTD